MLIKTYDRTADRPRNLPKRSVDSINTFCFSLELVTQMRRYVIASALGAFCIALPSAEVSPRVIAKWENQTQESLRQWKSIIQPEASHTSMLTTTGH